jgi:putative addiction module component (TIGR02574 family)
MTVAMRQELLKLSAEEKLQIIGELWDSLTPRVRNQDAIPDWHRQVIRKRLADHKRDPQATVPWTKVRRDLLKRAKA